MRPVPAPPVGLLSDGGQSCAATLVAANKALTLDVCVDASNEDLSVALGEKTFGVAYMSRGSPWACEGWAMLTLDGTADQPARGFVGRRKAAPASDGSVWLATVQDHTGRIDSQLCQRDESVSSTTVDCPRNPRVAGGLLYTVEQERLDVVGLDRGLGRAMVAGNCFAAAPDRAAGVALDPKGQLVYATDPDWRMVSTYGDCCDWSSFEPPPVPVHKLAVAQLDELYASDAQGRVWTLDSSFRNWNETVVPVSVVDLQTAHDGSGTDLWLLGAEGDVCRQALLPAVGAWSCSEGPTSMESLSVLKRGDSTLLSTAGPGGLFVALDTPGGLGTFLDMGEGSERYRAALLHRTQRSDVYLIGVTEDGKLRARLGRGEPTLQWSSWGEFDGDHLAGVEMLASQSATLVALADGHVYKARERVQMGMGISRVDGSATADASETASGGGGLDAGGMTDGGEVLEAGEETTFDALPEAIYPSFTNWQ